MSKKIAIPGSGGNGTAIGVDLVRASLDVTLIDQWPAHVEALRAKGARIETPDETNDANGAVFETFSRRGHPAPANAAIVEVTERVRCSEIEPSPENLHLIRELVSI